MARNNEKREAKSTATAEEVTVLQYSYSTLHKESNDEISQLTQRARNLLKQILFNKLNV